MRDLHGYNEFTVSTPEPVLLKFAKTIYESPLILLLFGSAIISAVMGNIDDAVSITIAILIVLTGAYDAFMWRERSSSTCSWIRSRAKIRKVARSSEQACATLLSLGSVSLDLDHYRRFGTLTSLQRRNVCQHARK